jgi:uroporphyrinogen decarboxylase
MEELTEEYASMLNEKASDNFLIAAQGRVPAQIPVALAVDGSFVARALQVDMMNFYTYPDRWLNTYLALADRFPEIVFLPGFWVEYGNATEPSAFGAPIIWRHDHPPTVHPLNLAPNTWCDLPRPDPYTDGLMALVIQRYWNLEHRGELPAARRIRFVGARGPFTIATHVLGAAAFLNAVNNPNAASVVRGVLDLFTDTTIRFLQAQLGCLRDPVGVVLYDDTVGKLPARIFERFARPALNRIFDSFEGLIRIYHNDTPCEHLLAYLPYLHFDVFHFSHLMDIRLVRAALAPKAVMGNLAPLAVMVNGTTQVVEAAARACIERAAPGGGLILAPGGSTHPDTPLANIDALLRATLS